MSGGLDVDRVPDTTSCGRCSFTKEVAPVATRIAHELDSVRLGASWSVLAIRASRRSGKASSAHWWIARSPYRGVVVWARLWRFVHAREKASAPAGGERA